MDSCHAQAHTHMTDDRQYSTVRRLSPLLTSSYLGLFIVYSALLNYQLLRRWNTAVLAELTIAGYGGVTAECERQIECSCDAVKVEHNTM